MRRAIDVLDRRNIGFDIIGTPPNEDLLGKWEGCTNIIVPYSYDTISFIDTVIFSMRMGRSNLVNKIKRLGCYAGYIRQRARYVALLKDLECKMKNI